MARESGQLPHEQKQLPQEECTRPVWQSPQPDGESREDEVGDRRAQRKPKQSNVEVEGTGTRPSGWKEGIQVRRWNNVLCYTNVSLVMFM